MHHGGGGGELKKIVGLATYDEDLGKLKTP